MLASRVWVFDARVISVAVGSNDVSGLADAEDVSESEVRARLQILIVEAGFEAGHDRAARADVLADMLALAITQHGDVGQKQRAIFAETLRVEPLFVHVVEVEAAAEEGLVDAMSRLTHVRSGLRCRWPLVEKLRALPHHHADIGDGAPRP